MTQYARPDEDFDYGNWETSGGVDFFAEINETPFDDDYYITSADWDSSTDSITVGLGNTVTDPVNAINHVVSYRSKGTNGGMMGDPPSLTVVLLETATPIASSVNSSLTGSYVDYTFTLSEAEANAIGNYDNLRLKFTRGARDSYGEDVFVSQAFFQCDSVATTTTTTTSSPTDSNVYESAIASVSNPVNSPIDFKRRKK